MSLKKLKWIHDKTQWDAYVEYKEGLIAIEHKMLEQSLDTVMLQQAQGRVQAHRRDLQLRDKVNADG